MYIHERKDYEKKEIKNQTRINRKPNLSAHGIMELFTHAQSHLLILSFMTSHLKLHPL